MSDGSLSAHPFEPEREELERKWAEFGDVRESVLALEAEIQELEAELRAFEQNYMLRCGARYTALDTLEAEIEERKAALAPEDEQQAARADAARAKASSTAADFQAREREGPARVHRPTPELKALYRRAARLVHPDLADSAGEQAIRHDCMVELNACYKRGDADRIRDLLVAWDAGSVVATEEDVGSRLVRVVRAIARLRERLPTLRQTRETIRQSEMALLHRDVCDAQAEGRDLIEELLEKLDQRIAARRAERDALEG